MKQAFLDLKLFELKSVYIPKSLFQSVFISSTTMSSISPASMVMSISSTIPTTMCDSRPENYTVIAIVITSTMHVVDN